MNVLKTLVIGLGTSGTEICDRLASRIAWEYDDVAKTPWVRFLCIETNIAGVPDHLSASDFVALSIKANDYSKICEFNRAYDDAIHLSQWADKKTLSMIPKGAVDDGVGNIRMVGRVAFFHDKNYAKVRTQVVSRLEALRKLTPARATEALGTLPDGNAPTVAFAANNVIRVIVVGTLCGGTCSGIAGDFGYFLQNLTEAEEKVVGYFTLPNPDLSVHSDKLAERK